MYAVVGCGECHHLWLVADRPETSECPRCGTRRPFAQRRTFVETDDPDRAREVRATMLAERSGEEAALDALEEASTADQVPDDGVIDEEWYLEASGLDPEAIAGAGDDRSGGTARGTRRDVIESAIRELDEATDEAIVAYASDRGLDGDAVRRHLEKLVRSGAATRDGGRYGLL